MKDFLRIALAQFDFPVGEVVRLGVSLLKALAALHRLDIVHRDIKADNIHLGGGRSEDEFVALREARDATLKVPALILPSLQINIRAGALPPPEASGKRFLKLPLNVI